MTDETTYDRRAFAVAYLEARPEHPTGYEEFAEEYDDALRRHRERVLRSLQDLFGVKLDESLQSEFPALAMLFHSTARSYLAITTPGSSFLEGGLLLKKLEETGEPGRRALAGMERVAELTAQSKDVHLDILDALIEVFLGDRADVTFTSADLRAWGVDDTPPRPA